MQYAYRNSAVEIKDVSDFDPKKIFECGQCFRWNPDPLFDGQYIGVAKNHVTKVRKEGSSIFIGCSEEAFHTVWRDYFDLDRDYEILRGRLNSCDYLIRAVLFGTGIRILRQDKWEALCSFIISQCNNIPRIKKIIEALCERFGDPILFEGKRFHSFPDAETIASLSASDLLEIRCGYRAEYILSAAKAVSSGALDLDRLSKAGYEEALRELKSINGIGDKVANCVILYGLQMHNAFPIDVWMKKALSANFCRDFDPGSFGQAAGLAQQYIFYYARSGYL